MAVVDSASGFKPHWFWSRVSIVDQNGNPVDNGSGVILSQDASDGPVAPGAAASKSMLAAGQYNSTPPTLTNTQQAALQLDASGNLQSDNHGRTSAPIVTPAITASSAYTAGNCVGPLMQFTSAFDAALSGILQRVTLNCKTVQTGGFKLYIFNANPSASTFTDKSAPNINAADVNKVVDVISLASPDSGLGTHTTYVSDAIADALASATTTLWGLLVCTGTPTFGSTSDVSVMLGILKD